MPMITARIEAPIITPAAVAPTFIFKVSPVVLCSGGFSSLLSGLRLSGMGLPDMELPCRGLPDVGRIGFSGPLSNIWAETGLTSSEAAVGVFCEKLSESPRIARATTSGSPKSGLLRQVRAVAWSQKKEVDQDQLA